MAARAELCADELPAPQVADVSRRRLPQPNRTEQTQCTDAQQRQRTRFRNYSSRVHAGLRVSIGVGAIARDRKAVDTRSFAPIGLYFVLRQAPICSPSPAIRLTSFTRIMPLIRCTCLLEMEKNPPQFKWVE